VVFPGGKERPGREADPLPTSSAVGHERVELYLYSPMGRTACTEPQCLYKGDLYLFITHNSKFHILNKGYYKITERNAAVQQKTGFCSCLQDDVSLIAGLKHYFNLLAPVF